MRWCWRVWKEAWGDGTLWHGLGVMGNLGQYGGWVMGSLQHAGRACLRPAALPRGHLELGGLWVRRETKEILERMDET